MNHPLIKNMTDDELMKVCVFTKSESDLTGHEFLITKLVKRLEASKEYASGHDNLLGDLAKLKDDLTQMKNTSEEAYDLIVDIDKTYN